MEPLLRFKDLRVGYRGRAILPPLTFEVLPGQIWALVGPNGGGKSTLLKTALGLLPKVGGTLQRRADLRTSYVPQRGEYDATVPARVIDFVQDGAERGFSFLRPPFMGSARRAAEAALAEVKASDLVHQQFGELSEGQKQRVLLARALISTPALLVMDEPTSAMDPMAERRIFDLVSAQRTKRDLAVVVSSHEMSFVPRYASHAVFVDRECGVVLAGDVNMVLANEDFFHHYGDLRAGMTCSHEH